MANDHCNNRGATTAIPTIKRSREWLTRGGHPENSLIQDGTEAPRRGWNDRECHRGMVGIIGGQRCGWNDREGHRGRGGMTI